VTRPPVLFVSAALNVGGAERQWSLLIPALRDVGFAPAVLTLVEEGQYFNHLVEAEIEAHCARVRHRYDVLRLAEAATHASSRFSVIITQTLIAQAVGHAIARLRRIPHITAEHQPPSLPRPVHERELLSVLAPRVTAVVGVAHAQLPDLIELGYSRSRIRIIPNGTPTVDPQGAVGAVRRQLNFSKEDFIAILVATLRPQKRAEDFVDAVHRASVVEPRIKGLVVGTGPELPRIAERASRTGGVVQVIGERTDVLDLLAMADVACLSSYAEGLPMVVLEAMSVGKPMVMTDVPGIRETIEHETTGLLVRVGDVDEFAGALIRLARDRVLAHTMGANAKARHLQRFSVTRMVERYALLLESVAAAARGGMSSAP
jgi:glycosyltransferase involved in cell wall biosynthesis